MFKKYVRTTDQLAPCVVRFTDRTSHRHHCFQVTNKTDWPITKINIMMISGFALTKFSVYFSFSGCFP